MFLLPGGRPLRLGTGAGVGGSAGVGTVAGAGSGSGSAGSAGSAAAGSGSEATGGSALSAISFKDYFIGRSPRKSQTQTLQCIVIVNTLFLGACWANCGWSSDIWGQSVIYETERGSEKRQENIDTCLDTASTYETPTPTHMDLEM